MSDDLKFQPPGTTLLHEDIVPAEGDKNVGQWVWSKFRIAKNEKDRLKIHEKMLRNHELIRGKHFKTSTKKYPLIPVNLFHVAFTSTKANLTDNKPKFDIIGHDDTAKEQAPIMHSAASYWWKRTRQQKGLSDAVGNSEKYGTAIKKMVFDASLEAGTGEIDSINVDPFKFFPWPGVLDIQRMPFVFEVDIMELADIRRIWPETGQKVVAEEEWSTLLGKEREQVRAGSLVENTTSGNLPSKWTQGEGADVKHEGLKRAMVIEAWLKDYTMEDVKEERPVINIDPETGLEVVVGTEEVVVGQKPKYPGFIRVIHITNDGKIVLDDVPNPSINPTLPPEIAQQTYLYDKYPYISSVSYTDETNFWGYSIVEQIETLVIEINKKVSQIAAYIDKTVRPTVIIPKNAGIEQHQISNLPGQIWWASNHIVSQYIRYLQIPSLPSDFYKYLEALLKLVEIITGIHDITEGRKPKGIAAASAIMALQEKAETIFREKIRNLDLLIEEQGRMWISLAQNWYTEPRKLQMSGRLAEQYGEFPQYRGQDFQGEFTFEVVSGSTMPKSIWARREQALQLFQAGAIDQRGLLDEFDWHNREEIIHRMEVGQLGMMLEKLSAAGVPDEILQTIQYVLSMDEKTYKKTFQAQPGTSGGTQLKSAQAGRKA